MVDRGNVIDNLSDVMFYDEYRRTYEVGSKTAAIYKQDMYSPVIRTQLNKTSPPLLLKDRFMLEAKSLVFRPHHFLLDAFDRKLQQYIEADLINYNTKIFYEINDPKNLKADEEPFAVLNLEELEAGFVVSLAPLFLGILVFAFEWIPTLKNLVVFLFIFKIFFKVKELEQRNKSIWVRA